MGVKFFIFKNQFKDIGGVTVWMILPSRDAQLTSTSGSCHRFGIDCVTDKHWLHNDTLLKKTYVDKVDNGVIKTAWIILHKFWSFPHHTCRS